MFRVTASVALALLLRLVLAQDCEATDAASGPKATLPSGLNIIGTYKSLPNAAATVNQFLGVPFASPPERFSPPEPFVTDETCPGTIEAKTWKPACIQQFQGATGPFYELIFSNPAPEESEDCLYLNVYAPSSPAPSDGRAVLFWIYGGSLQFGTAGQDMYDGSWFAAYEDVVVVTINYRTNVFGFPASTELPTESRNLGYLDQRLALEWVQENIEAFGGSPEKVTIFGESAGADSVDVHLTAYSTSEAPFRAAIAQSGQVSYVSIPLIDSTSNWDQLAAALDCPGSFDSNLTCVRAADALEIRTIISNQSLQFDPIHDNTTFFPNANERRLSGDFAKVPVLGGSNAQEGRVFAYFLDDLDAFLQDRFAGYDGLIAAIKATYVQGEDGLNSDMDVIAQLITDLLFVCGQNKWAIDTVAQGVPAWTYYYNASFNALQPVANLGVYHSSEIPLVFSTYPQTNVTTQQYALSESMRGTWAKFAKNPWNGPGWNQITTGGHGDVLVGASTQEIGGLYLDDFGEQIQGDWSLGVFGNRGNAQSSGVTVVDQSEATRRCSVIAAVFAPA